MAKATITYKEFYNKDRGLPEPVCSAQGHISG